MLSLRALPTNLHANDAMDSLDSDDGLDHLAVDELDEQLGSTDLDLAALRSDDALLNALGNANSAGVATEPELNALLLSWRRDVDEEPMPELVDTETAVHTIFAATHRNRRRPRLLVPLASAAAVLVIVFTGVGLAARDAQPGDALWGLTQVLYSDHARSVLAADDVRNELSHASTALHEGHYSAARNALAQAQQTLPSVQNEDGQADLQAQQQNLLNQLALSTGNGGLPVVAPSSPDNSITATVVPTTTPSDPPSSTTTTAPTTSTPSSSTGGPSSTPPSSTPSLQSATPTNPGSGGPASTGAGTGSAGANVPAGSSSDTPN
ncbi:MAG TPA: anti-sigma-D factor RsdA [Pseudonocardiaceae bacterium]|nr:anti-sigma-D factor RsdA [Pseudonocardiaceae bacterium]